MRKQKHCKNDVLLKLIMMSRKRIRVQQMREQEHDRHSAEDSELKKVNYSMYERVNRCSQFSHRFNFHLSISTLEYKS